MEITGADPLPYGIAPNRAMIDQLLRHAVSQHILDKPFTAEELFRREHPRPDRLTDRLIGESTCASRSPPTTTAST